MDKAVAYLKDRLAVYIVLGVLGALATNIIWLNVRAIEVRKSRNTKTHGAIRDERLGALEAKHKNGIESHIKETQEHIQRIYIQLTRINTQLELQGAKR